MSGLANRLVTAAGVHVSAVLDAETPEQVDLLAVKATAAVLRELAQWYASITQEDLRGLAEELAMDRYERAVELVAEWDAGTEGGDPVA